jgi:hypothetical protein
VETRDKENLMWIGLITNVIGDIIIKTSDMTIMQRGTAFLRFYIPLCSDVIIAQ